MYTRLCITLGLKNCCLEQLTYNYVGHKKSRLIYFPLRTFLYVKQLNTFGFTWHLGENDVSLFYNWSPELKQNFLPFTNAFNLFTQVKTLTSHHSLICLMYLYPGWNTGVTLCTPLVLVQDHSINTEKMTGAFYLHKSKLIYFFINYTKCWQIDVFVSFCVETNLILRGNNLWSCRSYMQLIYIEIQQSNQCHIKQECNPVGCVLSAAVAMSIPACTGKGGVCLGVVCLGSVCPGGCLPGGCVCPGGLPREGIEFLTHACENITLPQLRCRR